MLLFLQEVALAKEDARIRGRRERDEVRRDRFLNARTRIMGVDAQALDQQVADMRKGRTDAKESDRIENLRMIQIQNLLEQANQEEKYMRKQQTEELKHSWMSEIAAKKANQPEPYVLNLDECGASSAQNFGGDEAKRDEKARIQKEQMRTWVKDALLEQKYKQVSDKEEDLRYAALMQALDHYREAAEDEEKQMNHIVKIAVKEENAALAAEARIRNGKVVHPANMATSLDLFNEDLYMAMDDQGRIIRRDHFKGFTPAQLRRLMQENEMILQQKRDKATGDRNGDKAWTRQQVCLTLTIHTHTSLMNLPDLATGGGMYTTSMVTFHIVHNNTQGNTHYHCGPTVSIQCVVAWGWGWG